MGKANAFYPTVDGVCLSPEEISNHVNVVLELTIGIHDICDRMLARQEETTLEETARIRVFHAAMEKAIETMNHLYYEPVTRKRVCRG